MIRAQHWEQAAHWVAGGLEGLVFRRGCHPTILCGMNALPEACVDRHPSPAEFDEIGHAVEHIERAMSAARSRFPGRVRS